MTYYRIYKVIGTISSATQNTDPGEYPPVTDPIYTYKTRWGILVASGSKGSVSLTGGGSIDLSHLAAGRPIPCQASFVSCSSGTVYILG